MTDEKLKQIYKEAYPLLIQYLKPLKNIELNADYLKTSALSKALQLLETNKNEGRINKNWKKVNKKFAFNTCLYELMSFKEEYTRRKYFRHLYEKYTHPKSKDRLYLINDFKKIGNKKLNDDLIHLFKTYLSELHNNFSNQRVNIEAYFFIPLDAYIVTTFENYILQYGNKTLSNKFAELLENKIFSKQQKTNNNKDSFQSIFVDLWIKAQNGILTSRSAPLENYIRGALWKQNKTRETNERKITEKNKDFKHYILNSRKNIVELELDEEYIPAKLTESIKQFVEKLPKPQYELFRLKANNVDNEEILQQLEYEDKDSLKSQWYKVRKKFKIFFKQNPEMYEYLLAMAVLMDLKEKNELEQLF